MHTPDGPAERDILAPDMSRWSVHEISDGTDGGALIFASEAGWRRVRSYPPQWRELSDAELWALSWRR